jgi:hypothetical protein
LRRCDGQRPAARAPDQRCDAGTAVLACPIACLGGVLNERPTGDYLTVSDYPAFAALVADIRRAFICGDSIPPFLPTSERAGFTSRHR